jgi:exo-1,4-beta-D-glucosaminidase
MLLPYPAYIKYPDIYRGMSLSLVDTQQFNDTAWLFRTTFSVSEPSSPQIAQLRFKGLSYRANVFVNGVVTDQSFVGTFVYHNVDISDSVVVGLNAVVVQVYRAFDEVWPPVNPSTDLSITWIDWSPFPPGKRERLLHNNMYNIT